MNTEIRDGKLILKLEGVLNQTSIKDLVIKIKEALASAPWVETVLCDMERVPDIETEGINFFAGLMNECRKQGSSLQINGANPEIRECLQYLRMDGTGRLSDN